MNSPENFNLTLDYRPPTFAAYRIAKAIQDFNLQKGHCVATFSGDILEIINEKENDQIVYGVFTSGDLIGQKIVNPEFYVFL